MSDNITEAELTRLENCNNEKDWSDACEAFKEARGGQYPSDWWAKVMQSGLATRLAAKWGNLAAFDLNIAAPRADGSLEILHTLKLEDRE